MNRSSAFGRFDRGHQLLADEHRDVRRQDGHHGLHVADHRLWFGEEAVNENDDAEQRHHC
jgi:hypothetical protein